MHIGASIGLAITTGIAAAADITADTTAEAAAMLARADNHMYQIKHGTTDAPNLTIRL